MATQAANPICNLRLTQNHLESKGMRSPADSESLTPEPEINKERATALQHLPSINGMHHPYGYW
jgi:hypothetical protein